MIQEVGKGGELSQSDGKPLFAAAVFLSAFLLFSVQPMMGRMLAPLLGGAPAVWNTCLVFFQAVLLFGYAYAHWSVRTLRPRQQQWAQVILLLGALLTLPLGVPKNGPAVPAEGNPAGWLLLMLTLGAGLPFFALSSQAPLLQAWFARRSANPYMLYAASNTGSFIALLAYPVLIEPTLGLQRQSLFWMAGFALMIPLIWRAGNNRAAGESAPARAATEGSAIPWRRRALWVALSFIPSSLMQGVTTFLTTDVASLPLLWVVPLALYLLTFVLVFAEKPPLRWPQLDTSLAVAGLALTLILLIQATQPAWLIISLHLAFFFIASLHVHSRLAEARPEPARLTEFFLWMSLGGVLGGMFNALLAPVLFTGVVEYPLAIVLALLARKALPAARPARPGAWGFDVAAAIAAGVLAVMAAIGGPLLRKLRPEPWGQIFFAVVILVCFAAKQRPVRFALMLGAALLGGAIYSDTDGRTLHATRNFFGIWRVTYDPAGPFHLLYHGTTRHGLQFADPARQTEPLSYYHRKGPFGAIWDETAKARDIRSVGAVGLGAGSVLGYATPGQRWRIFEIDPTVIQIARNTNWFHYLAKAPAPVEFLVGDARHRMAAVPDASFDFLILDAFSSDTVPMHLLTREAIDLYRAKLRPGGVIALHISSRNLNLRRVVPRVAEAAGLRCFALRWPINPDESIGRYGSDWLALMRPGEEPDAFRNEQWWLPVQPAPADPLWTDDYCNLWSIIDWN